MYLSRRFEHKFIKGDLRNGRPRNAVTLVGIGYEAETFLIDNSTITYDVTKTNGSASVGLAVTFSAMTRLN